MPQIASAVPVLAWGEVLFFTVPGPPVGKARARIVYREGVGEYKGFTPEKTKVAEEEIGYLAHHQWAGKALLEGPVALMVRSYFPIPRSWSRKRQALALNGELLPTVKPDLDNCTKLVSDALTGIIWKDDSQVIFIRGRKLYSDKPRTEISVRALDEVIDA